MFDSSQLLPIALLTGFCLLFGLFALIRRRQLAEWTVNQRRGGARDEAAVRRATRTNLIASIGFLVLGAVGVTLLVLQYLGRG